MAEKWITAEEHEKHVDDEIYKFMEVVPRGSPPEKIKSKLSAYKGQFTKTENLARAQLEDVHSLDIEDYNSTLRNTLYNIKDKLDINRGILEYLFDLYLVVCKPDDIKEATESSKSINAKFNDMSSKLTLAIIRTEGQIIRRKENHELKLAELKLKTKLPTEEHENQGNDRNVPRIASTLQPDKLEINSFDPVKFNSWVEKFGEYLRANHVPQMKPNKQQISYARTLVEDNLYGLVEPKITRDTVAVAFDEDENVRKITNAENPSFVELLIAEWL